MKIFRVRSVPEERMIVPCLVYFTLQFLDVVSARIPNGTGKTWNAVTRGNQTAAPETSNTTSVTEVPSAGHNQTIPSTLSPEETIDNVTAGSWANFTDQQWLPSAVEPENNTHWSIKHNLTTVNTTGGDWDYLKSSAPESVTSDTWLTGPSGGLNSVSSGVLNPRQATSESAPTGARLPASPDNTTQFLPSSEPEPAPARDDLVHAPLGHGLGHKPINYPAMHVYRRLKDSSDSSGAEIIAIFGLILCILFIICIFTVDLSTVRRDIKRIRYRRLGRSIHLDNMESVEVTEGWQRL